MKKYIERPKGQEGVPFPGRSHPLVKYQNDGNEKGMVGKSRKIFRKLVRKLKHVRLFKTSPEDTRFL